MTSNDVYIAVSVVNSAIWGASSSPDGSDYCTAWVLFALVLFVRGVFAGRKMNRLANSPK